MNSGFFLGDAALDEIDAIEGAAGNRADRRARPKAERPRRVPRASLAALKFSRTLFVASRAAGALSDLVAGLVGAREAGHDEEEAPVNATPTHATPHPPDRRPPARVPATGVNLTPRLVPAPVR